MELIDNTLHVCICTGVHLQCAITIRRLEKDVIIFTSKKKKVVFNVAATILELQNEERGWEPDCSAQA